MKTILLKIVSVLASLRVTVVGLLLLLILTVWGTLYQAENGLFQAQERFYQSWYFLFWGVFPFPGAQLVMTVLFANLGASVLSMALRRRLTAGFVITHLGLALLLAAGGITYYWGREAHLSLEEGESSNVAISSRDWELSLLPMTTRDRRMVSALDTTALRVGRSIALPDGQTSMWVEQFHRNCTPEKTEVPSPPQSASGATVLRRQPVNSEPSENYPGAILAFKRDGKTIARVLLWGGDGAAVPIELADGPRAFGLRRQRLPLPASIELVDFKREMHPGTGIARSYSSDVIVRTGSEMMRKVHIAMNKPLRLHDFTFYQSSFSSSPGGREVSTFSVVRNSGRLVPYIATGMTGAGMTLHFSVLLAARLRRNRREVSS